MLAFVKRVFVGEEMAVLTIDEAGSGPSEAVVPFFVCQWSDEFSTTLVWIWRPFYFDDFPGAPDFLQTQRFIWRLILAIVTLKNIYLEHLFLGLCLDDGISVDWLESTTGLRIVPPCLKLVSWFPGAVILNFICSCLSTNGHRWLWINKFFRLFRAIPHLVLNIFWAFLGEV